MAENTLKARLLHAYKSESEWNSSNPILKQGEIGYVADATNRGRHKVGDGATKWKDLPWGDKKIWDEVNGIQIGGRNLLSSTKDYSNGWAQSGIDPVLDEDGFYYKTLVNEWYGYIEQTVNIEIGSYMVSFYARASAPVSLEIKEDSLNNYPLKYITIDDTKWKRYSASINIVKNEHVPIIAFLTRQADTQIDIKKIKLEKGNKPTDWTPAPEDKADVSHTHSASDINSGTLATSILPIIPVSKGGTGLSSLTSGQVLIGNGTGNITTRAIDTTTGGTSGSTSLITSGAVYAGLAGKANTHDHPYLKLDGSSQMTGDLKFSKAQSLWWNQGDFQQRIAVIDDSTADTAVFSFQQSTNSGSSFTDLMVIKDNGKVVANTFVGNLNGNASSASQIYTTLTNPSDGTTYCIPFHSTANNGNKSILTNDGIRYWTREGTTSVTGAGELGLGNPIAEGNAGNKRGMIYMYGSSSGYTEIIPGYNSTGRVAITLPTSSGTLALLTDNVASASKWQAARTLTLSGAVTGSVSIDGSGDVTLSTSVNHDHNRVYQSVAGGSVPGKAPDGYITFHYNVNTGISGNMPSVNNANAIINISRHGGDYTSQLGFSSDGNMYYRAGIGSTAWKTVLDSSNYTSTLDTRYIKKAGDTMTGALNFKNGTWNLMGDDAYIGDCNIAGCIGIKGANGATGIYFANYSGGTDQKITINGTGTMSITGSVSIGSGLGVSGASTFTGAATHNSNIIINPGSLNNWNEGIRINKATNNWATLVIGGASGSTAGTGDSIWSLHTNPSGNFIIAHNGSDNNAGLFMSKSDATIKYKGNVLLHSGNYSSYNAFPNIGKDTYISYPNGGQFTTTTSQYTGYLKIILPVSWTGTMLKFKVSIYNYANYSSVDYYVGGYNYQYNTDIRWINASAYCIGAYGNKLSNLPVHFGHNGSKCVIAIGNSDTKWDYPQVTVSDVTLGYQNKAYSMWSSGWSIEINSTALSNVTTTISDTHVAIADDRYVNRTGDTGITGVLRSNSEIQTTSANAFRIVAGNYGVFLRNDGSDTYFLITNSGDQYGSWNSLRPFSFSNSTGLCSINGNLNGNATTATTASYLSGFTNKTNTGTAIDNAITNGVYYVTGTSGILGQSDGSAFVQGYSSSWVTQIYQDYRTGQMALRGKNNGTWQAWRTVLDTANWSSTINRTSLGAMAAINANGYYGMGRPDGNTTDWIRTTSNGILPYQSGSAGSGHCYIGTSSWYFYAAYIDNIYGTLNGNVNGTSQKSNYLNLLHGDEINFTNGSPSTIWFNYRSGDSGANSGNTAITQYKFCNRNASTTGVTLVADSFSGNAASATTSNSLIFAGTGNNNLTAYQTSGSYMDSANGWASYIICNHGDGATYYNQTIRMPFWGIPQYSRLEDGTRKGWFNFITDENISSQSVNYASSAGNADTLDGYHGSTSATASTYVLRDSNNYIHTNYINSNTSNNENPSVSQVIVTNGSDNYYRKASIYHVSDKISEQNTVWPIREWWSYNSGQNINDIINGCYFVYTNHNAPATGILASFACRINQNYRLQIMGQYNGNVLCFRNKNGDNNTWMDWNTVLHSNNYSSYALPLSGGTMSGQIQKAGVSSSWIGGRSYAMIRMNSVSGYSPFASIKTTNGSWEIGNYDTSGFYNDLLFSYCTDANYNAGTNSTTAQIRLKSNGYISASGFYGNLSYSYITDKPDMLNCLRMYGGTALDSKGTTSDSNAQYKAIVISTATAGTSGFSKVLTDLPKGKYSVMIRMKITANSSSGNIIKVQAGDTNALKTFYVRPNMFTATGTYQTFGFTVDHNTTSFTANLSIGTALSGVTLTIDYLAIAPAFTAISSVA